MVTRWKFRAVRSAADGWYVRATSTSGWVRDVPVLLPYERTEREYDFPRCTRAAARAAAKALNGKRGR